jgi:Ca2+-transporting ATPase
MEFLGLSSQEAAARLKEFGPNELPSARPTSPWVRVVKILKEPMLLLLLAACALYLILGDLGEGAMLGAGVFVVVGISLYQDRKSEKALASLRELSSPRALVIRDGRQTRIAARDLVPGDFIILHEGDRVPADATLIESSHLKIDESLLTGESVPVSKNIAQKNQVFSSTLIVGGSGSARVEKTGAATEVGKIGKSLQEEKPEELDLNHEIRQMVRLFVWTGAIICTAIIILYGMARGDWLQAFLVGIATEMALLPEEFPVVLTIFLAMGAWRLSRVQVLIRHPVSIERLGAITVLCVDKTGTLTENQMTVAQINNSLNTVTISALPSNKLPEEFHDVVEYAALASRPEPFDPMEKAFRRLAEARERSLLHAGWELVREYPLSENLFAMTCVWRAPGHDSQIVAVKGAPEAVMNLCRLSPDRRDTVKRHLREMATDGLRVLGVARATWADPALPKEQNEFRFAWVGLIGLEDPLRPQVPAAVESCRHAGVRVIMMTGDHSATAAKIAEKAGIETKHALIDGSELNSLSDDELRERLKTCHVFSRVVPAQKLRIVKALQELGHVVGMTGDGVNDAPSLKWADVGIAMGARGTDVAREASDIVVLDDNFASIVSGIERGRLIFRNIKNAMAYIVSIHVPIAGLSILPVLLNWPLILFPVHIVFLELIIDPACSLLFEAQEADDKLMRSPPRPAGSRVFTIQDFIRSSAQGLLILILPALLFYLNLDDPEHARALTFVVLIFGNLALIFSDLGAGSLRSLITVFKKRATYLISGGVLCGLFVINSVPQLRGLFYFDRLALQDFAFSSAAALLALAVLSLWNLAPKLHKLARTPR